MAIEVNVVNYLDSSSAAAFAAARDALIRVGLKVYREKRGNCLYIITKLKF